ncbi:hypothetical protein SNEBB_001940 [Seison nebaliae]|nr:hypothetical protein SNEBB_001940 [Seison nebaliae]
MQYLSAYMLLALSGNSNIQVGDIKKVIGAIDGTFEEECAKKIVDELNGKDLEELISEGMQRVGSMGVSAGGAAASAGGAAPSADAEKKEEVKEEEEEEDDEDMDMGGMFGDDDF